MRRDTLRRRHAVATASRRHAACPTQIETTNRAVTQIIFRVRLKVYSLVICQRYVTNRGILFLLKLKVKGLF